ACADAVTISNSAGSCTRRGFLVFLARTDQEAPALTAESRPASLVAERAVRYLQHEGRRMPSTAVVRAVLATRMSSEAAARRVLETAFSGDPRLLYGEGGWAVLAGHAAVTPPPAADLVEPDHVLLILVGGKPARRAPFRLHAVAGVRIRAGSVLTACGGRSE